MTSKNQPYFYGMENTYLENQEHLEYLADQLVKRKGSVVPIIGAGMSMPTGLPSWFNFLENCINYGASEGIIKNNLKQSLKSKLNSGKMEEIAQILRDLIQHLAFEAYLKKMFDATGKIIKGPIALIPMLDPDLIITTNYDRVIESVWSDWLGANLNTIGLEIILPLDVNSERKPFTLKKKILYKLHGDIEKEDSWILTRESYEKAYREDGAIPKFLKRLFSNHVPLFLGCSLTEERITLAMREVGSHGFALMYEPDVKKRKKIQNKLGDLIHFIWINDKDDYTRGNPFEALNAIIIWLSGRIRIGGVAPSGLIGQQNEAIHGLERLKQEGRVLEAIRSVESDWERNKSFELAAYYLHLNDINSSPGDGLKGYEKFSTELGAENLNSEQKILTNYHLGRLYFQIGKVTHSLHTHENNIPIQAPCNIYQLKSKYELGNIYFSIENFNKSENIFKDLLTISSWLEKHEPKILVDILKFLSTLSVRKTLFSLADWPIEYEDTPLISLEYAERAIYYSKKERYDDGLVWAKSVKAFAFEKLNNLDEANELFVDALAATSGKDIRKSSNFYIRSYYINYLRRQNRTDCAISNIDLLKRETDLLRRKNCASLLNEIESHVLYDLGRFDEASSLMEQSVLVLGEMLEIPEKISFPLYKRLRILNEKRKTQNP